jgi:phytoene synthase
MQFQAQRAREAYADALAALPAVDRRPQRPGLIMATVYHALLEEIIADKFQVLHQRVSLTPIRKLWLAWSTWVLRWRTLRFSV